MTSYTASQWEGLLQQHDRIRLCIGNRLKLVDLELDRLHALRSSLTRPREPRLHNRRIVIFPSSTRSSSGRRKRSRDDTVTVAYLKTYDVQRRTTTGRTTHPFEDAGLYADEGNPVAQYAPVQLSCDEVESQQLLALFPLSPVTGWRKAMELPPAAVSRIASSLMAAGLAETSFAVGRRAENDAYLRVNTLLDADVYSAKIQRLLSPAMDPQLLQELRRELCADPNAVGLLLYTSLAERAVTHTMPSPTQPPAVELLGLRQFAKTSAGIVAWTFTQCCQCADRDVMESAQVQWAQVLRCAGPPKLPPFPLQDTVLYIALCRVLLQQVASAKTARQGYLLYVLTACGGYPHLITSKALLSQRGFAGWMAHVSEVFESDLELLR
ncbi:hypothetical protein ABL78_1574 [Leptomonas seymouri]|uniref:p46 protein n=1 Tax=Leptomonas seymouri TaxID=5684 RepID=Q8IS09_LEPSE|nr:p46 protein [Leptomonas seymouri]KPI89345.1 hypothetical protein ABL78_1574 [Leptomonas seymouri]|eukprot:KPI89345.1 hypothetical protein ABL78_1574 [Leptomonas seymouri]